MNIGLLPFACWFRSSRLLLLQSCPTLSDPMDCSLPGSSVHGIFKARVPEWGAVAFSSVPPTLALKFTLPETRDLQGSHIPDRWETTVQLINMPSAFQNLGSWGRRINVIDLADLLEGDGDRMNMPTSLKKIGPRTSLAVQRLRRQLPMQRVWVQSLVGELRSHLLH